MLLLATLRYLWLVTNLSKRQIISYHLKSKTYKGKKIWSKFNIQQLQKMINGTEEVCLLESWNLDISMNDKISEQQLLLEDPYDSIWLKIIAILSYFVGLITSAIMLSFINYENGHHGNFRSVINQLLSNLYAMVSKTFTLFEYTYA